MVKANKGKGKENKRIKRIMKVLPKKPKKAGTAFGAFLSEFWNNLGNDPAVRNRGAIKTAADQWKAMSVENRARYNDMVKDDRARYAREMQTWKSTKNFYTRPASVYALFLKDRWEVAKEAGTAISIGDMGKQCAQLWGQMTPAQKAPYHDRFARCQRRFQDSVAALKQGLEVDLNRELDVEEEFVAQPELAHEEAEEIDSEEEWDDEEELEEA